MAADAKAAVPGLIRLLNDPDNAIRFEAVCALEHIGSAAQRALPELRVLLHNSKESADCRAAAAEAIEMIQDGPDKYREKAINVVLSHLAKFEKTKDIKHLRRAERAIVSVPLPQFGTRAEQHRTREAGTRIRLTLLATIERHRDPKYSRTDGPPYTRTPEEEQAYILYHGMGTPDPRTIADPKVREIYEALPKKEEETNKWLLFQGELRNINRSATGDFLLRVTSEYTFSPADLKELDTLIQQSALSAARKQDLRVRFAFSRNLPRGSQTWMEAVMDNIE
jgi:hypothetical protein